MIDTGLPGEAFRLILRWAHVVAAIAWIGGAIFYLAVLRPALRSAPPDNRPAFDAAIARYFREVIQVGILVLLLSGVVLTVDRLSSGFAGPTYAAVLAVKIALSSITFWLAWEIARRGRRATSSSSDRKTESEASLALWLRPPRLILALGLIVVLLGLLLGTIYETALRTAA
jgi:uncharacterized membrane protein